MYIYVYIYTYVNPSKRAKIDPKLVTYVSNRIRTYIPTHMYVHYRACGSFLSGWEHGPTQSYRTYIQNVGTKKKKTSRWPRSDSVTVRVTCDM